ncbi:hypothetical protein WA158_003068 [Blastocystis sp. Blastoise]
MSTENILHFYRFPGFTEFATETLLHKTQDHVSKKVESLETEYCFNIQVTEDFTEEQFKIVTWLLSDSFNRAGFAKTNFLSAKTESDFIVEVGPRLNFSTAWSTNAIAIFRACGIENVPRMERSRRILLHCNEVLSEEEKQAFVASIHDKMTEMVYEKPLITFKTGMVAQPIKTYPVVEEGEELLKKLDSEFGLSFDDQDLKYYTAVFRDMMKRNPTDVELFDIAQSNSEHSRHWFFGGHMVIDGEKKDKTLFQLVKGTLTEEAKKNSVIAFNDNSSAIYGYNIETIRPENPGHPSKFIKESLLSHPLLSCETHNFPSGVAPFNGAETGTGGRIRDVQATGIGANVMAGTAGYSVGQLHIPGYDLPWEEKDYKYPSNLAAPLTIEIETSNGASDYGNKFGEPVVTGFTRSYGQTLPNKERREYIKPIMFSGGIGQLDNIHIHKSKPEKGMAMVKVGGPAYRIGLGGGAASSRVQDASQSDLDFDAVQRGDAEMENKMNRLIRACIEMRDKNPIVSIHDQGAGGNGNVLKEICDPLGAEIDIRQLAVGDDTMSVRELWGAEYQENDAILCREEDKPELAAIGQRENIPVQFVGHVADTGRVKVIDSKNNQTAVDVELSLVLGDMPKKTFVDTTHPLPHEDLHFPEGLTVREGLNRVFRLISVGSKSFLTNKVDRSVTGLIARQQSCGPLHIPISDVAVVAQSHFSSTGIASSIGEQPVKGLINPQAMGRVSVGEAVTNLVWAPIEGLKKTKCSGNWMWAAKLPGEASSMYSCCEAMSNFMKEIGVAVDGGKDSCSMAAKVDNEIVKAPGTLVISLYAPCPDVYKVVTPNLKKPGHSSILYIDISKGKGRLGATALASVYKQIGTTCADVEDSHYLSTVFEATQECIMNQYLLSGHDVSDGGLITTVSEMAFTGDCGLDLNIKSELPALNYFYGEELGLCMEVEDDKLQTVMDLYAKHGVSIVNLGRTIAEKKIHIVYNDETVIDENMTELRDLWEETSYQIELRQCNPVCAKQERDGLKNRHAPKWHTTYVPSLTPEMFMKNASNYKVAIIREEGSNGDREMTSAFYSAGFEVYDVHINDLVNKTVSLDQFRGIVFVGGFSYADVLESAKGWAGAILYNEDLKKQFYEFYNRKDTFSLGICNGCQLMAHINFVPEQGIAEEKQPRFIHNKSGRFESRFVNIRFEESNSVFFSGMAGTTLGVWVAHGEGQCYWPDKQVKQKAIEDKCIVAKYVDDDGEPTMEYPLNPNGSEDSIVGLTTKDGRHTCMMPHPERVFLPYQWPYWPQEWDNKVSPWLRMFQNARQWCENN